MQGFGFQLLVENQQILSDVAVIFKGQYSSFSSTVLCMFVHKLVRLCVL